MGGLFKSNKVQQATDPIAREAFDLYMGALNPLKGTLYDSVMANLANPVYGGQTYAGLDPYQTMFYNNSGDFGEQVLNTASGAMDGALDNVNESSDFGARINALGNALQDPNNAFNYAKDFANSDTTQGLIDTLGADVRNQLGIDLASNNLGSIGGGNLNNTRTGQAEGTLRSLAADKFMGRAADIRGNAFNQGLNQFNTNIGQRANNIGQMMNAYNLGGNALNNFMNMGQTGMSIFGNAGDFMRRFDQGAMDDAAKNFYLQQDRPMQLAGSYMGLFNPLANFSGSAGYSGKGQDDGFLGQAGQIANIIGTAQQLFPEAAIFCWVAREVYGEQNFKWRMFRHWMYFDAPRWLHNLYGKHGERIAVFVSNKPRIKRLLKHFMDKAIKQYGGPHGAI